MGSRGGGRWVGAGLLVACGAPVGDGPGLVFSTPACDAAPIALVCGAATDDGIAPLADGAAMTMTHGPAGGWSLGLGVSLENVGPYAAILAMVTAPSRGDVVLADDGPSGSFVALTYTAAACAGEYVDYRAYLDTAPLSSGSFTAQEAICDLAGEPLRVQIDVAEIILVEGHSSTSVVVSDRTARCELNVVAALDPLDEEACAAAR